MPKPRKPALSASATGTQPSSPKNATSRVNPAQPDVKDQIALLEPSMQKLFARFLLEYMDSEATPDPIRVGATVKALRQAHGWALGKFADKVGLSHSHLANIEAGRKRLTYEKARHIADTLAVPLAAIITAHTVEEVA